MPDSRELPLRSLLEQAIEDINDYDYDSAIRLIQTALHQTEQPFPEPPTDAIRIRPLIWMCTSCGVGRVRVFADFDTKHVQRIYQGKPMDNDDPALEAELSEARRFYGV
jgi:hypothetical protein